MLITGVGYWKFNQVHYYPLQIQNISHLVKSCQVLIHKIIQKFIILSNSLLMIIKWLRSLTLLAQQIISKNSQDINGLAQEQPMNLSFGFWNFIIMGLIMASIWLLWKHYLFPLIQQNRLVKKLKQLGYKVYQIPFRPLQIPILNRYKSSEQDHNDALYYQKHVYPYYDVIVLNFLSVNGLCFLNPELIKQFVSVDLMQHYQKIHLEGLREIIGGGIAFTQGEIWKKKRRVMSKIFNFQLLVHNIENMSRICDNCLDKFEQTHHLGENRYSFNVMELGNLIFNGIMTKCFLGEENIEQKIQGIDFHVFVNRLLSDATKVSVFFSTLIFGRWAYKLGLTKQMRDVKHRVQIFRSMVTEIIEKRKILFQQKGSANKITDLIEALLQERKNNDISESQYQTQEMVGAFGGLLIAGTDTTAHFLTMMVYSIARHPSVEQRLRKQIEEVIKNESDFTINNLKKITYIDWIQNETIRCFGPSVGLFPREVLSDHSIANIPMKKGMWVTMTSFANHFNEQFFPNPYQFRPERWQSECQGLFPYLFMGFGGGPRTCLGKQLALLDSKIALIKIMKRYKSLTNSVEHPIMKVTLMYEPHPFDTIFVKNLI